MASLNPNWHSSKGNSIQNGESFNYRFPIATIALILLVLFVYLMEKHPDPNIHHGEYILSAFSVYTSGQLFSEIVMLAIGGFIAEQFVDRWKMMLFYLICAPVTVYIVETFGRFGLVEGMSGGTMGLLGFSIMCILWYLFEDKESEITFIAMFAGVVICIMWVLSAFYGYSVSHFSIFEIKYWYSSSTAYLAHVSGSIIGIAWWLYEHYSVNTV